MLRGSGKDSRSLRNCSIVRDVTFFCRLLLPLTFTRLIGLRCIVGIYSCSAASSKHWIMTDRMLAFVDAARLSSCNHSITSRGFTPRMPVLHHFGSI